MERCIWQKPALDRAGQVAFWDRQYGIYQNAPMTVDNAGEMDAVLEVCRSVDIADIITFGGAVGCRDPLMIFQQAICPAGDPCSPPNSLTRVRFNDLSPALLGTAADSVLERCQDCGADITYHPGAIVDVAPSFPTMPRTLIIGVYSAMAFFVPNPIRDYPEAGFDEYVANHDILGEHFWHDYLIYNGQSLSTLETGMELDYDTAHLAEYRDSLMQFTVSKIVSQRPGIIALQVIGTKQKQQGYFISNWFDQASLTRLINDLFPDTEYTVEIKTFPKGFLYAINRIGTVPKGVITMLNNVFGNVIPSEQIPTLEAVRALI